MDKSKIYTTTGDTGVTSLVGGQRVKKTDIRIEAYGTVDELNSVVGVILSTPLSHTPSIDILRRVQHKLFNIGAYLATPNHDGNITTCAGLTTDDIAKIEAGIDELDSLLPPLNQFVLPAGTKRAAIAHVGRTVCRRAERTVVALADQTYVDPNVLRYLNRLSDFLFVLARFNNVDNQVEEIAWNQTL